jgi:hypothetical protein
MNEEGHTTVARNLASGRVKEKKKVCGCASWG